MPTSRVVSLVDWVLVAELIHNFLLVAGFFCTQQLEASSLCYLQESFLFTSVVLEPRCFYKIDYLFWTSSCFVVICRL